MRLCNSFAILLLAIAAIFPSSAGATEYLIRPITLDDGLSQSSARCVLRDRKGFLWIGTNFGLNRYDNDKVTNYYFDSHRKGTITDQQVEFLTLDPAGDLFVGLAHGMVKYDYLNDTFEEVFTEHGKRIDARSARTTKDGILIGGYGKLYFYDSKTKEVKALPSRDGSHTAYSAISKPWSPGHYILQTRWDGLWMYNSNSSIISPLKFCKNRNITAIEVDKQGRLWAAAFDEGVMCYDHKGNLLVHLDMSNSSLSSNIIHTIVEFEGHIWIGSEQGIDIIDPKTFAVTNFDQRIGTPRNCTILCLCPDQNGSIYAGTLRHGVLCIYKVPMRTFTQIDNSPSIFGFTATSIIPKKDSHNVWVGFDGEGIALFDPFSETFTHVPGTTDIKVTSLAQYDPDNLIVATYNQGIKLLNTNTLVLSNAPAVFNKIMDMSTNKSLAAELFRLNDGRVLSATDKLFAINPSTQKVDSIKFTGVRGMIEKLNPIYADGEALLFNDKHNLYRYIAKDDTCGVIYTTNPGEEITAATYDGASTAWVATNKSLEKYDIKSGRSRPLNSDLVHNITSLALENDRVWIGADNKLFVGAPDDAITVFGPNDGMAPNQFINKAKLLTDDYLLLGGVNGMLKINREDIKDLLTQPSNASISISDVFVDNSRVVVKDGVAVVPNNHSTIKINIIDHDNSGVRNKLFRYKIVGFGRDLIIETFDRSISLNMLPSGKYHVFVSYSLSNGKWSKEIPILELKVKSPLWLRWWAILLYAIIFIGALIVGYYIFMERRKRRLEELKQNALVDKVNFLTHLHTELRTPLTLILSPLNALIDKVKEHPAEQQADTLSTLEDIYNNSMQMRDIIEALPETQSLALFPKDDEDENKKPEKAKKITELEHDAENDEDSSLLDDFDTTAYTAIVIESSEKLRSFLVSHLQSVFKQVEVAENTRDAMRIIKDTHPDIIIADVDIPGEDVYDFCRDIKNTPGLRHIPVILLTSGNTLGQKRKTYAHGADSYISKPFDIEVLISRCKNLLLNRAIMRRRYEKTSPAENMASKTVTNSDESFILKLDQLLADNLSNPKLGVEFLSKNMLLSRTAFYARMRELTGKSIGQYISDYRLSEAKKMLTLSKHPMNEIAEALGFSSQRYFSTFFKDKTGMSPSEYRISNTEAK